MRKNLAAATAWISLSILTGCAPETRPAKLDGPFPAQPEKSQSTKRQLNPAETKAVEEGVKRQLKDPNSAIFGPMLASTANNGISYVCGTVNARNSFGGYNGQSMFVGVLGALAAEGKTIATFTMVSLGETNTKAATVADMCRMYGIL